MNQETIERAARAHYESLKPVNNWEGLTEFIRDLYRDIARAVIAAIHPTVDSVEELDALPSGSAIKTQIGGKPTGRSWAKIEGQWYGTGLEWQIDTPALPATVLYTPGSAA